MGIYLFLERSSRIYGNHPWYKCRGKKEIPGRNLRSKTTRVRIEIARRWVLVGITGWQRFPAVVVVMVYEEVCVQQCLRTSWQIARDELVPSSSTPSLLILPSAGDCSHITLRTLSISGVSHPALFSLPALCGQTFQNRRRCLRTVRGGERGFSVVYTV
jgi:hypothetical protein